tara:strand:- start:145 stop:1467 length:1323 start_codon:yes stop_codon:yes gene_type:complete
MSRQKFFNSDTFCAMPFVGVNVTSGGNMRYCCFAEDILEQDGFPLSINEATLKEGWNSTTIKEARKKMMDGEEVPGCARCTKEEDFTNYGPRISMTSEWLNRIGRAELVKLFSEAKRNDYVLADNPVYLDLRLGNLCNLKCRMCNPWNSSQIDKENKVLWNKDKRYREVFIEEYGGQAQGLEDQQDWFEADILWDDILDFIPSLKKVYFTGGEPTMIKGNFRFLEECIKQGRTDIVPFFNTNLTNRNKNFTKLISQFDQVDINGSLDGFGEMNDYIRPPAKWSAVSKNFEKYASFKNIHLGISPVFQVYNIFNSGDLIKYIEDLKTKYKRNIHIDFLLNTHPVILKAEILPYSIREKAQNKLYKYFKTLDHTTLDNMTKTSTEKILNYLTESKEHNDEKVFSFINYTKSLDKHRNQSMKSSCPELYTELYKYYPKQLDNE